MGTGGEVGPPVSVFSRPIPLASAKGAKGNGDAVRSGRTSARGHYAWPFMFSPRPVLLPLADRVGRLALHSVGIATRWVDTPQGSLHVYDARGRGSLPPVVLLHGLGASATAFAQTMTPLLGHVRRVIAPDYPGHGFSPSAREKLTPERLYAAVDAVLEKLLGDEPAILVANSLGGAVAFHRAITRPALVKGLLLASPAGARVSEDEGRTLRASFDLTSRADALQFLDRVCHRTPWVAALVAHEFPAAFERPAVRELLETITNDSVPTPEQLSALPMPILFLWGASERLLPPSQLAYFRKYLPAHAVIERPEGVGHCPHIDDSKRFAERILDFARSIRVP